MESALGILRILLPFVIVGGIAVVVILRMKHKYNKGTLGKKESEDDQTLLDSLIPFGTLIGLAIAILLSLFSSATIVSTIA